MSSTARRRRWPWIAMAVGVLLIGTLIGLARSMNATEQKLLGIWRSENEGTQTFLCFESFRGLTEVHRRRVWPLGLNFDFVEEDRRPGRWSALPEKVRIHLYQGPPGRRLFAFVEDYLAVLLDDGTHELRLRFAGPDRVWINDVEYLRIEELPTLPYETSSAPWPTP